MGPTDRDHHSCSWLTEQKFRKILGIGMFGVIFETSDTTFLSAVKVNFLRNANATHANSLAAPFHLVKSMSHPNVTKIYNVSLKEWGVEELETIIARCENLSTLNAEKLERFYQNGLASPVSLCVQIELCGPDLLSWLRIGKTVDENLSEIQYKIISGILDGLRYLHQNDIVHRHISPEAVMFSHTLTTEYIVPVKISSFQFCRPINFDRRESQDGGDLVSVTDPLLYYYDLYLAPEAKSSSRS
ncbi:calcium/calmodulin-dependent protein kinase I-like [Folsomia candida]|uniref:calcium/calmodulin-dependent protein kinase I-like n=1 Tax=Folsomia candida TaxID=158441 RepID=UPI0016055C72|nr:calcium/calmodulin-dependent protein kinase I-like [Folsomia candida]